MDEKTKEFFEGQFDGLKGEFRTEIKESEKRTSKKFDTLFKKADDHAERLVRVETTLGNGKDRPVTIGFCGERHSAVDVAISQLRKFQWVIFTTVILGIAVAVVVKHYG